MSEWKKVRLGDILLIQKKSKIKASDGIENGIYPFFTCSNDIVRTYNSAQYKGPALIFGTGGKASVHFCDTEFSTSTDCLTYYPVSSEINLDLVNKYIQSNIYLLENGFKGAGLKHVSRDYIANIEINLPDIKTQNCIVQKLNKAKNIISNSKKLLTKYDLLIKSRFIEMFGNPIQNPMNWPEKTVSSLCNSIYGGGTPSKKHLEYYTGDIPWVSSKDMKSDYIIDSLDHITQEAVNNSSAKMVPINSIIMVIRSGILKHTLPVAINKVPITVNQDLKAFIPSSEINVVYMARLFKMIEKDVLSGVRAVTADNIEFDTFKARKIPLPPLTLQTQFATFVQQVDKSKFTVQKALEKTETLYKSLMQRYFA